MAEQLRVTIDNREVDLYPQAESPVQISYNLEDEGNFQSKGSGTAFDITFPATVNNDQNFNSFHNPAVVDNSPDSRYRKARKAVILKGTVPLLVGKALLQSGSHTDRPQDYNATILGDNGDWLTDMQDLTLYDCLPTVKHVLNLYSSGGMTGIEDSWLFDGYNEAQSWVYAPVRYGTAFADNDVNMQITQMRPSLFIYWVIARAFKRSGYSISSSFMDSPLFRRMVMPWTFGNFLGINSKLVELLKFRATGATPGLLTNYYQNDQSGTGRSTGGAIIKNPSFAIGDSFSLNNTSSDGGYDNNGNYSYDDVNGLYKWTYKTAAGTNFGKLTAFFGVSVAGGASANTNSNASLYCTVFKNGVQIQSQTIFYANATGPTSVVSDTSVNKQFNFSVPGLVVGDVVAIQFSYSFSKSFLGQTTVGINGRDSSTGTLNHTTFELFRVQIEPGGIVDWSNFQQFKNYKFLDFLRGVLDSFDIIPKTDPVLRSVTMEPSYGATVGGTNYPGYFLSSRLDWTNKLDISQPATVESFTDAQRDYVFQMKDDGADGGVQILQKRFNRSIGLGKFRFSSRFKEGVQTFENRFFTPVVHLKKTEWGSLPNSYGRTPQIVAIVPERLADTSSAEAEEVFGPKLCYYKGYIQSTQASGAGAFRMNGYTYTGYPLMFAVNYLQTGAEQDIALTYNDQLVNGQVVPGLLRRFFLQRMAIQDNGVRYHPWMMLNDKDVTNWLHRERIVIKSNLYTLLNIDRWDPLRPISSQVTLWKFVPVEAKHANQVYPSNNSVRGLLTTVPSEDLAYQPDFILTSDLPTIGS